MNDHAVAPSRSSLYRRFAHLYDHFFARAFARRIHRTIRSMAFAPGTKILEVGVGTGLSLQAYPPHVEVTGIDLSREMLDVAADKVQSLGWKHIQLRQMDALQLEFPSDTFDAVTAFHVVSVIPDVHRGMREMVRVCKPGGKLIIINHLQSENRLVAGCVKTLDPLTRRLGWRVDLRYHELLQDLPVHVERRYKSSPLSLFTILLVNNLPAVEPQTSP